MKPSDAPPPIATLQDAEDSSIDPSDESPVKLRPGQRVGGRSERVVRDVMRATSDEISRVGYARLRVEDVAAAAGVNKTTVYRRWPTKVELVDAAIRTMKGPLLELPDLGTLRLDLMALLRETVRRSSTCEGRSMHRMITLEIDHPEVAALSRTLRSDYFAPWVAAIERAVTRGELPPASDAQLLVEMITGPVFGKLRFREDIDDDFLDAVVNLVIIGAKGGGAIRRAPAAIAS